MVEIVSLAASTIISGVVALFVTEYQLRRKRSIKETSDLADWYDQAEKLANDVLRSLERNRDNPVPGGINFTTLQGELEVLERQISTHANEGRVKDASANVTSALKKLADACDEAASERISISSNEEFEVYFDEIREAADSVEESVGETDI